MSRCRGDLLTGHEGLGTLRRHRRGLFAVVDAFEGGSSHATTAAESPCKEVARLKNSICRFRNSAGILLARY